MLAGSLWRMMRCLITISALPFVFTACSEATDVNIKHGFYVLDTGYSSDVQPPEAKYSHCDYTLLDSRHVARCGFSFGRHELEQVGYWELEKKGEKVAVYAMNGEAQAALAKLTAPGSLSVDAYPDAFHSGADRPPLDISRVDQALK